MKHAKPVSRQPIAAQTALQTKLDFMVNLIEQVGDLSGVVLEVVSILYGLFLHWPLEA